MLPRRWKSYDRKEVLDIKGTILSVMTPETRVMIGTDAQMLGRATEFVTVLIFYKPGKGGRVFFSRMKVTRELSLWEKLSTETWTSLEAAMMVEEILGNKAQIEVHVDANSDPIHKSSDYVKQLCGMVTGSGFKSVIKPDANASSHAADRIVKGRDIPTSVRKASESKRKSRRRR